VLTALIESGIDDEDVREGMARLFLKSSVAVPGGQLMPPGSWAARLTDHGTWQLVGAFR